MNSNTTNNFAALENGEVFHPERREWVKPTLRIIEVDLTELSNVSEDDGNAGFS